MIKRIVLVSILLSSLVSMKAQDVYEQYREEWLRKSQELIPVLQVKTKVPIQVMRMIKDEGAYQKVRAEKISEAHRYFNTPLGTEAEEWILDFGEHVTGKVSFVIEANIPAHAPVQLRIKFAEVPAEMDASFDSYEGTLSKAWLQEEIITLQYMPDTALLPGRYAFRYMKFEVLASAPDMDFYIRKVECHATTSAGEDALDGTELEDNDFQAISDVSLKTLEECMQTVFEDGPKRDRRIWIGDLKLQALANYQSFRNFALVKRSLYLYAATAAENGLVYGTLLEKPAPHPQLHFPIDYCLLYNTTLTDYLEASHDTATVTDLWIVARYQVLNVLPFISKDGIFTPSDNWWYFIDWNNQLDKQTALHGIVIYSLEKTWELAQILNKEAELPHLPETIGSMKKVARQRYFNKDKMLFTSGPSNQISTASQVWMILSGTVSPEKGKSLFRHLEKENDVVRPVSPYLCHYETEAMIQCGMYNEAKEFIREYWGGMVRKGADTFWEVYDPENDFLSPYGSFMMNSYCHAWSCTPVYFLRKYNRLLFPGENH